MDHSQIFEQQLILGTKPGGNSLGFSRSTDSCAYPHVEQERVFRNTAEISHQSNACLSFSKRQWASFCSKIMHFSTWLPPTSMSCCTFWDHFVWIVLMEPNCYQMALCRVASGARKRWTEHVRVAVTHWPILLLLPWQASQEWLVAAEPWVFWSFFCINVFRCNLTAGYTQKIFPLCSSTLSRHA